MKTPILLILFAVLFSKVSYGDIIISNTHFVQKCVKITNVEDYPEVTFIGYAFSGDMGLNVTVLSSTECMNKGYKFNEFNVYAVNKSYLQGKEISKINFRNDPNALPSNISIEPYTGYISDSIPISAIEEYYKVVGFSDSNVILYKWKKVTKYNNGKPDLIETFTYNGDVSPLYQKITVGVNTSKKQSGIEVFPTPANKNIHLRINDPYNGKVLVELLTADGKVLKTFNLDKPGLILDYDIPVANMAKGVSFVKVQMGKQVEYKRIIIK